MPVDVQKLRDNEFNGLMQTLKESWKTGDMNSVAMAAGQIAFKAEHPEEWLRQQQN